MRIHRRDLLERYTTVNIISANKSLVFHKRLWTLRWNILVIWSQLSDGDWHPLSIVQLRVDADPLPPRTTAEQHHLPDTWRNGNGHPASTFSTDTEKKQMQIREWPSLLYTISRLKIRRYSLLVYVKHTRINSSTDWQLCYFKEAPIRCT